MPEINAFGSEMSKEEFISKQQDFANRVDDDGDYLDESDYNYTMKESMSPEESKRFRRKKVNVLSMITSSVITGAPILFKHFKRKREGLPTKLSKYDIGKIVVGNTIPVIMAADDILNKGRLQDKTGDLLSHARNITNIVSMYPEGYKMVNNMVVTNAYKNKVKTKQASTIPIPPQSNNFGFFSKIANLFSPYVIDTMCDDLPIMEKLSNIMPITVIGGLVQRIAYSNKQTARIYDIFQNSIRTGSSLINGVGGAVRSNSARNGSSNNSLDKNVSKVSGFLETLGTITGVKMNNGYNNGYGNNGYGGNYYGNHNNWGN